MFVFKRMKKPNPSRESDENANRIVAIESRTSLTNAEENLENPKSLNLQTKKLTHLFEGQILQFTKFIEKMAQTEECLRSQIKSLITAHQEEKNCLKSQILVLQQKLHRNIGLTNQSIQKLLRLEEFDEKIRKVERQNKRLTSENQLLKNKLQWSQINKVTEYEYSLHQKVDELKNQLLIEKNKSAEDLKLKEKTLQILTNSLQNLKSDFLCYELETKNVFEENKKLSEKVKLMQKEQQIIKMKNEEFYQQYEKTVENFIRNEKIFISNISELQRQRYELEDALSMLKMKLDEKDEELLRIKDECFFIVEENEKIRRANHEIIQNLRSLESVNKHLEDQISYYSEVFSQKEKEIMSVKEQISSINEEKRSERESLRMAEEAEKRKLQQEVTELKEENRRLREIVNKLQFKEIKQQEKDKALKEMELKKEHFARLYHFCKLAGAEFAYELLSEIETLKKSNSVLRSIIKKRESLEKKPSIKWNCSSWNDTNVETIEEKQDFHENNNLTVKKERSHKVCRISRKIEEENKKIFSSFESRIQNQNYYEDHPDLNDSVEQLESVATSSKICSILQVEEEEQSSKVDMEKVVMI